MPIESAALRFGMKPRGRQSEFIVSLMVAMIVLVLTAIQPASAAAKRIALTIDDIPSAAGPFLTASDRRARLIAALKTAQVRQAAIFVNPGRLALPDDPVEGAAITDYAAAGHVLANHGFAHLGLSATSADVFLSDAGRADRWLRARPGFRPWFRYPYLDEGGADSAKRDRVRAGLAALGLRNAPPTIDAWDWNFDRMSALALGAKRPIDRVALERLFVRAHVDSADAVDRLARRLLHRSPIEVMLLHECDTTALHLVAMIDALRADGWHIVTVDRAFRDPLYRRSPGAKAGGLLIDAIAAQRQIKDYGRQRYDDPDFQQREFDRYVLGIDHKQG